MIGYAMNFFPTKCPSHTVRTASSPKSFIEKSGEKHSKKKPQLSETEKKKRNEHQTLLGEATPTS